MSHDHKRSNTFKPEYLTQALECFATEAARLQQIGQQVLSDMSDDDDNDNDTEWTPGCEDEDNGDEDDDDDSNEDIEIADDSHDFLATPNFDALFPHVQASKSCIPTSAIKQMWRKSRWDMGFNVPVYKQQLFFTILERALNAYVKSEHIEPHRLEGAFAPA